MNSLFGCIKWLFRSRHTKQLDEKAMAIADRYGMRKKYLAARKLGYSPLEALEDWDMVKEEERQLLVEDNRVLSKEPISTLSLASFIVSVFALFASLATIVVTVRTNNKTNVLTERLNSKEYQISENLKYDLIELVAVLRAIDSKATTALYADDYEIDYSNELQMLKNIQTRPGYLVFLHSIKSDSQRKDVEISVQHFIDFYLSSPTTSSTDIRQQVHIILNYIGKNADLKGSLNMDFVDLLKDLCQTETAYHFKEEYVAVEHEKRDCDFVWHLLYVDFYDDPDLEYYYSYFCDPDTLKAKKAVEDGAICVDLEEHELDFWKWYLWGEIEENYSDEYHAFCKRR